MMYDRECLYNVEWQKLRVSLLGTWTTLANVKMNVYVLRRYHESGEDRYERATRCSNYLSAILLGYGSKAEFVEQATWCASAQKMFAGFRAHVSQLNAGWDWVQVKDDLHNKATSTELKAIRANLTKRIYTSTKRTGGTQHRPELMKFVGMLDSEIAGRGL
jgi:hypothetical protein